jgi:PAS domain S-box-containing protein
MLWSCLMAAVLTSIVGFAGGVLWERRRDAANRSIGRAARLIVEGMPALGWSADPDGNFTYVSPGLCRFFGLSADFFYPSTSDMMDRAAAFGTLQKSLLHPDDLERTAEAWRRCRESGAHFSNEHRVLCSGGVYRWIRAAANPARDASGKIVAWYGTSIDIDELKQTQFTLRQREQAMQRLIDTVPVHIWCADADGEPTYMNQRLRTYLGFELMDLDASGRTRMAQTIAAIVHPDDAEAVEEGLRRAAATGASFVMQYRQRRADGVYRWIEGRSEPLHDENGTVLQRYGICIDIDDQKRADEALRERERELVRIVDAVPAQVWSLSADGATRSLNRRLREHTGIAADLTEADEPLPFAALMRSIIHRDDREAAERALATSLETGAPFAARYRLRRADGCYRWTEGRAEAVRDADGAIVRWYGICFDVEELAQVEEALRRSEGEFRSLVDTLPAMIWSVHDYDGPTFFNKTLLDVTDYRPDDQAQNDLATAVKLLVHPDDYPALRIVHERDFRSGIPVTHRFRVRQADGSYRWVEGRSASRRDESGHLVGRYGILIDVDREVSSQMALRRSQDRLTRATQAASLAELSASIAHEVNQPLAAIVANAHACQRWLVAETPNVERARLTTERVIRDAHAAADVVGRIRALFRQSTDARAMSDINRVLDEACALMVDDARAAGITLAVDPGKGIPAVDVDRVQIQQVLINLIRNGIEAMETDGNTSGSVTVRSRMDRGDLVLEVHDEGAGVADADRIFDPFVTTKPGGMGMGLAICRSIVEAHSGRLYAERCDGRGTVFRVALPVERAAAS